jgi:hypothetical protein
MLYAPAGACMELLITDVTEMGGGNYCVAGWDIVANRMVRPLDDGSAPYQFTVSSKVLKEAWRNGGLAAVNNALPARQEFHVRIGLARPFDNPPKCYAMLNGVL